MNIVINGQSREVTGPSLADVLAELGQGNDKVATAVNESFVPAGLRQDTMMQNGDRVEIVAPRQGG